MLFIKKKYYLISISFNVLFLGIFKYSDFVIQNINYLFNSNIKMLNLPFPFSNELLYISNNCISY